MKTPLPDPLPALRGEGEELAAVYRRVSTDKQDGSLETQEKRVSDYLGLRGFAATEETTFFDEDTSGGVAILERPGGTKLFATLRRCPEIKHLVLLC